MPTITDRFSVIGASRRAPWAAMETWSSWLAEVGVESVEQGLARCLFSLISAAVVTSAIIRPELRPGAGVRKGGRSKLSVGSTISATRRWAMAPISASGQRDLVGGEGHRLGVEIAARDDLALSDQHQRVVGDGIGLDLQRPPGLASRSAQAPATCGWQRMQ
jgi:hypothetical protein